MCGEFGLWLYLNFVAYAMRSNVPKFGNWENEDNVPYTVFFDKARKNRGGKMINPNDPQENPDMFPSSDPPPLPSRTRPEEPIGRGAVRPTTPEHRVSREDGDFRQFSDSPARNENMGNRTTNESNYGGRGQRPARPARPSAGSDQSFDRSPLHPHYQAKVTGRGSGSPAWEGKSHDSSHGTAAKSRLRPARGDESPDKGAAVPRFGEWNENDPQSAENFTHIFNKVREERNTGTGAGNMTGTPKHPSYGTRSQPSNEPKPHLSSLLAQCRNAAFHGGRMRRSSHFLGRLELH
ncbi:RPM1-interacting protein 4 [Sesamum angolense]|uniref:RPM1-interacting protein 4 n=1 Tax=Sesamum angolense TaxID=2727404 RepID=A0AAE1XCC1_9LAMI|nr:RPM1-interacting protein 4 [Sesamum angolense]